MNKTSRIIGKILGWLWGISTLGCIYAEMRLQITDMYRQPCNQVAEGAPFLLNLECDFSGINAIPAINGLEHFSIEDRRVVVSTLNGASTTSLVYQIRARKRGSYTVGPAVLT